MSDKFNIKIEDLSGDQRELAETIGLDAYIKLVKERGGTSVYIAKQDKLLAIKRNAQIISEFNGFNHRYLALKYNISDRTLREIIEADRRSKSGQQLSLFDKQDGEKL